MTKQKFRSTFITFLFGIAVWCILQNSYTLATFGEAVLFSFIAAFAQASFFHIDESNHDFLNMRFLTIIKYIFNLIVQIYIASFKMIINIVKGRENVKVVRVPTKLTNHWHRIITATSITLTPGTISITEQKKYLWVVGLDLSGESKEELANEIKGSFEEILLEEEIYKEKKNEAKKSKEELKDKQGGDKHD